MSELSALIYAVVFSCIGFSIIILRRFTGLNQFVLDGAEWLLLAIAPIIPLGAILSGSEDKEGIFLTEYFFIIMTWFLLLVLARRREQTIARRHYVSVFIIFGGLIIFGLLIYFDVIQL